MVAINEVETLRGFWSLGIGSLEMCGESRIRNNTEN
jgi:hypothetical protein